MKDFHDRIDAVCTFLEKWGVLLFSLLAILAGIFLASIIWRNVYSTYKSEQPLPAKQVDYLR